MARAAPSDGRRPPADGRKLPRDLVQIRVSKNRDGKLMVEGTASARDLEEHQDAVSGLIARTYLRVVAQAGGGPAERPTAGAPGTRQSKRNVKRREQRKAQREQQRREKAAAADAASSSAEMEEDPPTAPASSPFDETPSKVSIVPNPRSTS